MKSKITDIKFNKEVTVQGKQLSNFAVSFASGDEGTFLSESNPPKQKVGEEYDYEVKVNGNYKNVKFISTGGKGGFAPNPAVLETNKKIAALNNAVAMVCAGKASEESLRKVYEKFLNEYL